MGREGVSGALFHGGNESTAQMSTGRATNLLTFLQRLVDVSTNLDPHSRQALNPDGGRRKFGEEVEKTVSAIRIR